MNKRILFFVRIAVTVGIVVALLKIVPYSQIVDSYRNSDKLFLFLALSFFVLNYFIGVMRWKFFINSLGVRVSFREAFYPFFCGLFFNLFFVSVVAGDVFRAASLSSLYGERKKIASSVLMDRFSGASALAAMALIAAFVGRDLIQNQPMVAVALFSLSSAMIITALVFFTRFFFRLTVFIFMRAKAFYRRITSIHDQLHFFTDNPYIFFKSLLFSIAIQVITVFGFYFSVRAFGVDAGLLNFFVLVPIVMAIALIPVTIAGVGTRDAAVMYFFSLIGIEKSVGLSASFLNLFSMIAVSVFGGMLYVAVYHRYLQKRA